MKGSVIEVSARGSELPGDQEILLRGLSFISPVK